MAKDVLVTKILAITTVVMTASALAGIITMVIVYQRAIDLNPPVRPTEPNATETLPTGPPPDLRLPGHLVPQSYDLFLQPLLYTQTSNTTNQTLTFVGNSSVSLQCVSRTRSIFLHSKDLNLTLVTVKDTDSGQDIPVSRLKFYTDDSDFLEIRLKEVLEVGSNYTLFTAFKGVLGDDLVGLYVSKYTQKSSIDTVDNERLLATSQMQPTDARRVLPCFDEPAMKAEFKVTIIHRDGTTALGNGKDLGSTSVVIDGEDWVVTRFRPMEKMSTYLLAFAVSNFKFIKSPPSAHERVEISIHARPEAIDAGHADYAASITGKILTFYERLFDLDYPFQKLDQLAVPDLMGGAMENWGLITYRESSLLYEEGVSSPFDKEDITTIVAHELAHQWFGNLVTMKWWNNLWLNEGFATYLSYLAVDHVHPDWNIVDFMVINEIRSVFQVDSLASSHPLSCEEKDVQSSHDIIDRFDGITYNKGSAVLRMLADYISERVFNIGLRSYLKAFKNKNVDEKDLWRHLQQAVDEDKGFIQVAEVMYTWTNQMGYPVITINTTNGEVEQQHFLINRTSSSDYELTWSIPIRVMKSGADPTLELLTVSGPEQRPAFRAEKDQWVLANINCTGYYRVNYNPENWESLLHQLETNLHVIPQINRGQLIDDAFNLARAQYVNVTLALRSTRYLRNETEYLPWDSALRNLEYFILMFDRSEVYGPMQAYLRKQVSGLYAHFENFTMTSTVPDSHSAQYNQISAIEVACSNLLPACQNMAQKLFKEWMMNHTYNHTYNPIHPNLRYTLYCQAVAAGGEEEWEFAWEMYQNTTSVTEKNSLQYALSCTSRIWLLNRYLEYTLDPNKIKKMDVTSVIAGIAKNVAGQALAWDFVRAHWSYLNDEYVGAGGPLIYAVTERFSTDFELQQLRLFQSTQSDRKALDQVVERTQVNIQWVRENKRTVLEWLREELRNPRENLMRTSQRRTLALIQSAI